MTSLSIGSDQDGVCTYNKADLFSCLLRFSFVNWYFLAYSLAFPHFGYCISRWPISAEVKKFSSTKIVISETLQQASPFRVSPVRKIL